MHCGAAKYNPGTAAQDGDKWPMCIFWREKGWQRRVPMLFPKIVCVPQAILRHYLVAWPRSIVLSS